MTTKFSGQFQYQWSYLDLAPGSNSTKNSEENCKKVPFFDNSVDVVVAIVVVGITVVTDVVTVVVTALVTVVVTALVTFILAAVVVAMNVCAFV